MTSLRQGVKRVLMDNMFFLRWYSTLGQMMPSAGVFRHMHTLYVQVEDSYWWETLLSLRSVRLLDAEMSV